MARSHFSADFRSALTSNQLSIECFKEPNCPGLKQQKGLEDHSCHLISKSGMPGALPHVLQRDIFFADRENIRLSIDKYGLCVIFSRSAGHNLLRYPSELQVSNLNLATAVHHSLSLHFETV